MPQKFALFVFRRESKPFAAGIANSGNPRNQLAIGRVP
jgi:hypothetical protein